MADRSQPHEAKRLAELAAYDVLDSEPEEAFEELAGWRPTCARRRSR